MTIQARLGFAAAALACLAGPAFATQIGPDAFGYTAEDVSISWTDISGSGTSTLPDEDDGATTQGIGFTFSFYGVDYTTVSWTPNGLLTFGGTNNEYSNQDLTTSAPSGDLPSIAVLWDDLVTYGSADAVWYQTTGSAGSRQFIVQWNDVNNINVGGANHMTFEAILFEGSNRILMQYLDVDVGDVNYDAGASATVGIRDTDGQNTGNNLQWSVNSGTIASGSALSFSAVTNPEPGTFALFGLGAAGIGATVLRRRRRGHGRAAR